jgi:ribosomal protein L2
MIKLLLLAPFAIAALLLGGGLIATSLDTEGKEIQQLAQQGHRAAARAAIEASTTEATQGLAVQRYQSGACVYVGNGVEVAEGQIYQLPSGTCVADGYGRNGLTDSAGVVGQIATTQDQQVIQQFLGW